MPAQMQVAAPKVTASYFLISMVKALPRRGQMLLDFSEVSYIDIVGRNTIEAVIKHLGKSTSFLWQIFDWLTFFADAWLIATATCQMSRKR